MNHTSNKATVIHLARLMSLQEINVTLLLDEHLFVLLKMLTFTLSFDDMKLTYNAVVVSRPAQPSALSPPSLEVWV